MEKKPQKLMKFKEVFPDVDLSAFDWIEDVICFDVESSDDTAPCCYPFKGMYIQLTFKRECLPSSEELMRFQASLESQIGCKTDCTGTPEKCRGPHAMYHLPSFTHDKVQKGRKLQKLELTWVGKEKRARLEPRVLVEKPELSHHAATRRRDGKDIFDNMLIHGDNLLALKALEQQFAGKVKCIYIDPPYNTGNAFEHYDDGLEHSIWLGLVRERLELLYKLLAEDGSIWISIDDDECHYLKVLCDEIFGRQNFVATITWQRAYAPKSLAKNFSRSTDFILVYAKDYQGRLQFNKLPRTEEANKRYKNIDNDPRGPWKLSDSTAQAGHGTGAQFYDFVSPNGKVHKLPPGLCWRYTERVMQKMIADNRVWFGKDGNNVPAIKRFLSEVSSGIVPQTLWTFDEVGHTQESKKEILAFKFASVFDTPKPERLIQRILTLATNPGDLVLDSFLGSGTTAAVAHKMGRRWIGVELGDHCYTHCKVRLDKVIDGEDAGGITKAVGWKGGGGYRFYELAPTLITKDQWGQEVINRDYNPAMLAEAVCKLEGYIYAPSQEEYFIHGHATEKAFIYVTTNYMRKKNLAAISERLGAGCQLLICCKAFDKASAEDFDNLTVKKIPDAVLKKCEWGHDDYSLNVKNLPMAEEEQHVVQDDLF